MLAQPEALPQSHCIRVDQCPAAHVCLLQPSRAHLMRPPRTPAHARTLAEATFAFASAAGCRRTDFAVTPRDPSAASTHVKADERSGQVRLRVPRIQGD